MSGATCASKPRTRAPAAIARASRSVANMRACARNILRGNWSSRSSSASAPSALVYQALSAPAAAASCNARKRARICSSNAVSFSNQRSGPASRQNAMTSEGLTVAAACSISCRRWRIARFVAQGAAQDLADIGLRQFAAEFDLPRHLVAGESRFQEGVQLRIGEIGLFLHREQLGHFAGMRIRYADHGDFHQAAMAHGHFFDLVGENFEARNGDHVLLAVDDAHAALL